MPALKVKNRRAELSVAIEAERKMEVRRHIAERADGRYRGLIEGAEGARRDATRRAKARFAKARGMVAVAVKESRALTTVEAAEVDAALADPLGIESDDQLAVVLKSDLLTALTPIK